MGVKTRKLGNANNQIVQWQAVHTASTLNAVAGRGYFINTTSNICTITLPTPAVGDIISFKDYARTWGTNKITFASSTFDGVSITPSFDTDGQTVNLIYMDSTKGWSIINEDTTTNLGSTFVTATGGTVTESGNFKIHSFTGDSNFVVSGVSDVSANNEVSYIVVGGGGGGAAGSTPGHGAGGGGAGGFRESKSGVDTHTASPLAGATDITVSAATYPITVGGGGPSGPGCANARGTAGSVSTFSTITSAGGGGGGGSGAAPYTAGGQGASGGGGSSEGPSPCGQVPSPTNGGSGGGGNVPAVSPPQGNHGGYGNNGPAPSLTTGGGGGATAVGGNGSPGSNNGAGGAGATTQITGGPVAYSGGGGGGGADVVTTGGTGGTGGGASGIAPNSSGPAATANTGGGGGGGGGGPPVGTVGTNGGKGIVIIRYKFQ
jgi:hypothetical protein